MAFKIIFFLVLLGIQPVIQAAKKHICILSHSDFKGENAFAYRIQAACNNIDWKADVIDLKDLHQQVHIPYDFAIHLLPNDCTYGAKWLPSTHKHYLTLFLPGKDHFNKNGTLRRKYHFYDGYLLSYSPELQPNERNFIPNSEFRWLSWYPTGPKQAYQRNSPTTLFYICAAWGNRLDDEKFKQLLTLLNKEPYMRFYGAPIFQNYYPQSYRGVIPFQDNSVSLLSAESGITLVLHSSEHNQFATPSGRIFEAAAASTVIICDQNDFVKTHFGDSVLYINTDEDALSIHHQIQCHMEWIQSHPIEALEKARQANAIFNTYFSLEDQLINLGNLHENLLGGKREIVQ